MELEAISVYKTDMLLQNVAINILKNSIDFQQQAALQLIQSLPEVHDSTLGNNIDTYA